MRNFMILLFVAILVNLIPIAKPLGQLCLTPGAVDDVVKNEARVQLLRPMLPRLATVGYITDGEVTKNNMLRLDDCRRFYMTQYALAPNIVVHGTEQSLVIGNFTSSKAAEEVLPKTRLTIVKDFGDGLLLLNGSKK